MSAPDLRGADIVLLTSTSRPTPAGIRRVPDRRTSSGREVAAYLVGDANAATEFLKENDVPGRTVLIDVEQKQPFDLMRLARANIARAAIRSVKPNDSTVDATDSLIQRLRGPDLTGERIVVVGTGNIGFKAALRLAERGAQVFVHGRNASKVAALTQSIRSVLPAHTRATCEPWPGHGQVGILIGAVTVAAYIDASWAPSLSPRSLLLDVGLNNFSPELLSYANGNGHRAYRVDVRICDLTIYEDSTFYSDVFGEAVIAGVPVVAGGVIGQRGTVIVDRITRPTRVIGVADGSGGLLGHYEWSTSNRQEIDRVEQALGDKQARP